MTNIDSKGNYKNNHLVREDWNVNEAGIKSEEEKKMKELETDFI